MEGAGLVASVMDPSQGVGVGSMSGGAMVGPGGLVAPTNEFSVGLGVHPAGPHDENGMKAKKAKKLRAGNNPHGAPANGQIKDGDGSFGLSKPYLQQTLHTQQDTQRKLESHINRVAHTPDFKPGAYKAAKLSADAARLLADFIQRPAIRAQLQPLVGDLPGKKRKSKAMSGDALSQAQAKAAKIKKDIVISQETGRRLKTRLSAQQTKVLEEKYTEKPQWKPTECAGLVPALATLGPPLTTEQVSRWFDNKRRAIKKQEDRVDTADPSEGGKRTWKKRKVERRVRHSEREMLEAAYAQNSAPDIHVRTALATAIGISEKQVTAWYTRRQQTGRAPYGVTPGSQNAPPQAAGSQQHPGSMGGQGDVPPQMQSQVGGGHMGMAHMPHPGQGGHMMLPGSVPQSDAQYAQGMQQGMLSNMGNHQGGQNPPHLGGPGMPMNAMAGRPPPAWGW